MGHISNSIAGSCFYYYEHAQASLPVRAKIETAGAARSAPLGCQQATAACEQQVKSHKSPQKYFHTESQVHVRTDAVEAQGWTTGSLMNVAAAVPVAAALPAVLVAAAIPAAAAAVLAAAL